MSIEILESALTDDCKEIRVGDKVKIGKKGSPYPVVAITKTPGRGVEVVCLADVTGTGAVAFVVGGSLYKDA